MYVYANATFKKLALFALMIQSIRMLRLGCLLLAAVVGVEGCKVDWGYANNGAASWPGVCRTGREQSPIDIRLSQARPTCVWQMGLNLQGYDRPLTNHVLRNTAYTAQIQASAEATQPAPSISGGGLDGEFSFLQLHFHWGVDDYRGSEHTLSTLSYPMQLHLVHTLSRGIEPAQRNRLAVLGVFVQDVDDEADPRVNPVLADIARRIPAVLNCNATTPFDCNYQLRQLLPADIETFFRYNGSLTIPMCAENVQWTQFHDPIYIARSQLAVFRTLRDAAGRPVLQNHRPTQPLGDRQVYLRASPDHCASLKKEFADSMP